MMTSNDTAAARPVPKVRKPEFPFDSSIDKRWLAGSAVATHLVNGVNLLFPHGERFFVRSVRYYLDRVDDPELRAQVKGFFGQEGRHAHEHERYFEILESQGYEITKFLRWYVRVSSRIEAMTPPAVRLATTAAAEHFTATLAENALESGILDNVHPVMRELLLWHASEEIEHKAVAFDVLELVAPSYAVRMAGLAIATLTLGGFWFVATRELLRQDGMSLADIRAELAAIRNQEASLGRQAGIGKNVFLKGILEYIRPGFHPWQNDNLKLAQDYLASVGRA